MLIITTSFTMKCNVSKSKPLKNPDTQNFLINPGKTNNFKSAEAKKQKKKKSLTGDYQRRKGCQYEKKSSFERYLK